MKPLTNPGIEEYAARHTAPSSFLLQKLLETTYRQTEIPQMAVGHLEGAFLKLLVQILQAKRVLEIGTFTGYSALAMAEGLSEDGELITCDINKETVEIAKAFWQKSPHGKKIKSMIGPALQTIERIQGPFDFVFIDADKENYIPYWEAVLPKVAAGGLIVADNVLWSGTVLNPKEADEKAVARFNEHVVQDKRVESVMLTVRDGVTLARKRS